MGDIVFWIIIAFIVFVVWYFRRAFRLERQRSEGFSKLAAQAGFSYEKIDPALYEQGLRSLHLFQQGVNRNIKNSLKGHYRGVDVIVFDYEYAIGGRKQRRYRHQSVTAFRLGDSPLPRFELRPERVLHKIGQVLGYKDIDFDHNPEFSKQYLLRGEDEQAVRQLFKTYVLDYFKHRENWCVEADEQWLVVYQFNRLRKPGEITRFLDETIEIRNLFLSPA